MLEMRAPYTVSIGQRVNAERLVLLGWTRAILLQFAHPLIAAGIYEHSNFRARPSAAVRRLRQTVRAMLALTFGSSSDRQRTIDRIAAIHRRVHGRLPEDVGPFPTGTHYSAEDPALLLWVHATLIESVPMFYEMLVAPLTDAERDEYCASAASVAIALGADAAAVPLTWAALQRYLADAHESGEIVVGRQAEALGAAILSPPFGPLAAPGAYMNRLLTAGTMPPRLREAFGLDWNESAERRFQRLVPVLRGVRRWLPEAAATWREARRTGAERASTGEAAGTIGLDRRQ